MAGMGTGLSNFQNHQWDMQKLNLNLNTQKEMQGKALENARTLTAMNNATARGVAVQQGQNSLNVTNARIAGSNPIGLLLLRQEQHHQSRMGLRPSKLLSS